MSGWMFLGCQWIDAEATTNHSGDLLGMFHQALWNDFMESINSYIPSRPLTDFGSFICFMDAESNQSSQFMDSDTLW